MKYRSLGRTGVRIAPLALGTDNFANPTDEAEAASILDCALDAGINLIDTANSYSGGMSEEIIGRALKRNKRRNDAIIATKFHFPVGPGPNDRGNSRLHIMRAVEDSLRRLDVDTIDLYQAHRPSFEIPLEETLGALTDLVRQGKVRFIGSTTCPAWHLAEAQLISEMKNLSAYVCEQSPYNLLDRRIENEVIPVCQKYGLGLICWSPMAMGMLAGRYKDAVNLESDSRAKLRGGIYSERVTNRAIEYGNRFCAAAEQLGLNPAQLAVLWAKDQPGVTAPIIGPRTVAQLEQMIPVLDMELSVEARDVCNDIVPAGSAVANFFNSSSGWMKQQIDF